MGGGALSGRCLSPGYSTEIARDAKDDFSDIIFDKDKDKDKDTYLYWNVQCINLPGQISQRSYF